MHPSVFEETRDILAKYKLLPVDVVDVGSLDVNGTYKDLFPDCQYTGVDVTSGPNVDLLMPNEFEIPLYNSTAGLVVCGSCLEHCRNPHRLVEEIFRVLRPGGWALLNAPMHWREHRYPLDCFRILPDGMAAMLELAGFNVVEAYAKAAREDRLAQFGFKDCFGVGQKPRVLDCSISG